MKNLKISSNDFDSLKISYKDEDGDIITLSSEEDYIIFYQQIKEKSVNELNIEIKENSKIDNNINNNFKIVNNCNPCDNIIMPSKEEEDKMENNNSIDDIIFDYKCSFCSTYPIICILYYCPKCLLYICQDCKKISLGHIHPLLKFESRNELIKLKEKEKN